MLNFVSKQATVIRDHLRIPFYNNAYSIIGVQATTSVLGFLFWVLVARFFTADQIGLGTGIYSAAFMLIVLAELGFGDGLTYYLPRVGNPNRLINAYFSISSAVVLIFAAIFILGQSFFSPELEIVRRSFVTIIVFLSCTLLVHVSLLQDTVFTADRVSKYGLTKNIIVYLLRFPIFLILLFSEEWSLILSMALASAAGIMIIGRQYQRVERPTYQYSPEFDPRIWKPILGFSFGNYVVNTLLILPNTLLPLIILNKLGPASNGYFYLAWMLSGFLAVIGRSFGTSLFVESGREFNSVRKNTIRSIIVSTIVLIPAVLVMVFFSSEILHIFGQQYSQQAAELVKLLSISCIPLTYFLIAVGVLKSKARIKELLCVSIVYIGMQVAVSLYMIDQSGLKGVGEAVLITRLISAMLAFILAFWQPLILLIRNLGNKFVKVVGNR